jgi:FHA domain-containing protein
MGRPNSAAPGFDFIDLELPNVSRKHARIVYDGAAYHLENWQGRLGIGIYERRLDIGQSHMLRHCDRFRIPNGDGPHVRLIFLLADQTRYLPCQVEAQRPNMRVFGLDVKCSPLEHRLLLYLQQHAGQLCCYDELIAWPRGWTNGKAAALSICPRSGARRRAAVV